MISVIIKTPNGDKTIGMISDSKEFEWALNEIRKKGEQELNK